MRQIFWGDQQMLAIYILKIMWTRHWFHSNIHTRRVHYHSWIYVYLASFNNTTENRISYTMISATKFTTDHIVLDVRHDVFLRYALEGYGTLTVLDTIVDIGTESLDITARNPTQETMSGFTFVNPQLISPIVSDDNLRDRWTWPVSEPTKVLL